MSCFATRRLMLMGSRAALVAVTRVAVSWRAAVLPPAIAIAAMMALVRTPSMPILALAPRFARPLDHGRCTRCE